MVLLARPTRIVVAFAGRAAPHAVAGLLLALVALVMAAAPAPAAGPRAVTATVEQGRSFTVPPGRKVRRSRPTEAGARASFVFRVTPRRRRMARVRISVDGVRRWSGVVRRGRSRRIRLEVTARDSRLSLAFAARRTAVRVRAVRLRTKPPGRPAQPSPSPAPAPAGEQLPPAPAFTRLVFADEFSDAAGTAPAAGNWQHDVGGHGWGNNELQTFTARAENAAVDGQGHLNVVARQEAHTGPDGFARDYTSARIQTKDRFSFTYGHVEARIKSPAGKGLWPLFWMMGDDVWDIGWPWCGEIDVMEMIGNPHLLHAGIHGPRGSDGAKWAHGKDLVSGARLTDDFHVYGVRWWQDNVEWLLDGVPYYRVTRADVPAGGTWVFDKPFHLILSLPVGGDYPGAPTAETQFPATMSVDWVRVYQ